ncbi:MAG: HAD-IIIA family hydrolase [Bacteroidota bacterium]
MNYLEKFRDIKTFIFDVDGVLTDSSLYLLENGHMLRKMNTRDGYAIKRALQEAYRVAIITGGQSSGVIQRLRKLGIVDIYSGISDKKDALDEYLYTYDIDAGEVLYMGDDMPDYEVMRQVGLPACPTDAAHEIVAISQYISPVKGGHGCVRDVIERTMRIQSCWLTSQQNPQLSAPNNSELPS